MALYSNTDDKIEAKPKKRPKHRGIKTSENGINTLKLSSKVSE